MKSVNILIAFPNTIRLSAHILIASVDALIVVEHTIQIQKRRRTRPPLQCYFFYCHVVTLSHTASNTLNKNGLQA